MFCRTSHILWAEIIYLLIVTASLLTWGGRQRTRQAFYLFGALFQCSCTGMMIRLLPSYFIQRDVTVLPACQFVYNRLHFFSRWSHHQNVNTLSGLGVQYWHRCPLFSKCGSVKMNMRKLAPLLSIASAFEYFYRVLSVISSAVSHIICSHSLWGNYMVWLSSTCNKAHYRGVIQISILLLIFYC